MNRTLALTVTLAAGCAGALTAPGAVVGAVARVDAQDVGSTVTQLYGCTTPVGDIEENIQVTGTARKSHGGIALKGVVFTFFNDFGVGVTIKNVRFAVPDPDAKNAPYKKGSARVSAKPKGWTAGHRAGEIYELHKATMDLGDGATLEVPALSASYGATGPKGTVVKWRAGTFSFDVTQPDPGAIVCTPEKPWQVFASYTE